MMTFHTDKSIVFSVGNGYISDTFRFKKDI